MTSSLLSFKWFTFQFQMTVVLSGLTAPLFLRTLSAKASQSESGVYLQNVGMTGVSTESLHNHPEGILMQKGSVEVYVGQH